LTDRLAGATTLLEDEVREESFEGRYMLSSTAAGFAATITEHRDLVHPRAELRGRMRVDRDTAQGMIHLLGIVIGDLSEAQSRGDIDAYLNK
jgi:hypothetical protein